MASSCNCPVPTPNLWNPPLTLPRERYHPGVTSRNPLISASVIKNRALSHKRCILFDVDGNKFPKTHKMKCPRCNDDVLEEDQELSWGCSKCRATFCESITDLSKQEVLDSNVIVNNKADSSAGK